jgi:hypothetical protein
MEMSWRYLALVPLFLLFAVRLAVLAHRLRLLGDYFRAIGALVLAATFGIFGCGFAGEDELIVPLVIGAVAYWLGVAFDMTLGAETYKRIRALPRRKRYFCQVDDIRPAPARFSFWRMLVPGLVMLFAGVAWAALSPRRHQPSWGVLVFVGALVVLLSIWLRQSAAGPELPMPDGDRPDEDTEQKPLPDTPLT